MSGAGLALVAVAGLACGAVNSVAGGGSLILFPALLGVGLSPLDANVTNSVATWPGYIGGVVGFRRDLRGQRPRLLRLAVTTVAGSTTGCVILLVTPGSAFDVVVPALVLLAALLLALSPRLRAQAGRRAADGRAHPDADPASRPVSGPASGWWRAGGPGIGTAAFPAIFLATVYGGYFGGALGVIVLSVLALTIRDGLRRLNALKGALSLVDATVSVVIFGLFGPVHWTAVLVAAPTTLVGGYLGAAVARRLDERVLRWSVVLLGTAVGIWLAVR